MFLRGLARWKSAAQVATEDPFNRMDLIECLVAAGGAPADVVESTMSAESIRNLSRLGYTGKLDNFNAPEHLRPPSALLGEVTGVDTETAPTTAVAEWLGTAEGLDDSDVTALAAGVLRSIDVQAVDKHAVVPSSG